MLLLIILHMEMLQALVFTWGYALYGFETAWSSGIKLG